MQSASVVEDARRARQTPAAFGKSLPPTATCAGLARGCTWKAGPPRSRPVKLLSASGYQRVRVLDAATSAPYSTGGGWRRVLGSDQGPADLSTTCCFTFGVNSDEQRLRTALFLNLLLIQVKRDPRGLPPSSIGIIGGQWSQRPCPTSIPHGLSDTCASPGIVAPFTRPRPLEAARARSCYVLSAACTAV